MTITPPNEFGIGIQVADPNPDLCKICGGIAPLIGVVDFNKHCPAAEGFSLPLSGVPVYYRRCRACSAVFTQHCDNWTPADFAAYVYNDDYVLVDPDYVLERASANSRFLRDQFEPVRRDISLLDFGGGNGQLASLLKQEGFDAVSFDPFVETSAPTGTFRLVTCFEVLEHTPRPTQTIAQLASFAADDGMVLFSTLLIPDNFHEIGLAWWYVAPRNGHVTFYTRDALARLWALHGFKVGSFGDNLHVAWRNEPPSFARHLFG